MNANGDFKMAAEQSRSTEHCVDISKLIPRKDCIGYNPFPKNRKDQVTIYVRTSIVRIWDVDTVRQEFRCELDMRLRWEEPDLEDVSTTETTWDFLWDPRYHFVNAVKLESHEIKKAVRPANSNERNSQIVFDCNISGIFKEILEIEKFPLDYQDLCVTLASKWKTNEVIFVKDDEEEDSICETNFFSGQEWKLCHHVLTKSEPSEKSEEKECPSSINHPQYRIQMNVVRRHQFYLYNMFLTMCLITLLTFASFAVPASSLNGRMKITLTLLLTSVAFKYYVQRFVPPVSYLTFIGKYILSCMIFQFSMALYNIISCLLASYLFLSAFEKISLATAVLAFTLMNAYFGYCFIVYNNEAKNKEVEHKNAYFKRNPKQKKEKKGFHNSKTGEEERKGGHYEIEPLITHA